MQLADSIKKEQWLEHENKDIRQLVFNSMISLEFRKTGTIDYTSFQLCSFYVAVQCSNKSTLI